MTARPDDLQSFLDVSLDAFEAHAVDNRVTLAYHTVLHMAERHP